MEADLWGQVPMAEWHTSKGGKKKRVFRVKEETFFPGHNVGDFVVNFYFKNFVKSIVDCVIDQKIKGKFVSL